MTTRVRKHELMEQARRAGWRGKTYRKAKRFERMLERQLKPDVVAETEARTRRPRWRRWFAKGRR